MGDLQLPSQILLSDFVQIIGHVSACCYCYLQSFSWTRHGAGGKVRLSFKADMVGLITLDNAEYWVDVEVKQMKPKNGTNTTDTDSQESTPLPKENNGSSDKKEEPTATDSKVSISLCKILPLAKSHIIPEWSMYTC